MLKKYYIQQNITFNITINYNMNNNNNINNNKIIIVIL